jgi:hypothetical protein
MEIEIKTMDDFWDGRVKIEIRATPGEAEVVAERLCEGSECPRMAEARQDLLAQIAELVQSVDARDRLLATATKERNEARETVEVQRQRVADLEADLERYQTAHVCTSRCSINSHVAFEGSRIVKDLERELAESRQSTQARDRLLATATEERDRFKAGMETAEVQLKGYDEDRRTERDRADENREWAERAELNCARLSAALVAAEKRLDRISGAVHNPVLRDAFRTTWDRKEPRAMAEALRQVRDALGSPLPSPGLPEVASESTSQA